MNTPYAKALETIRQLFDSQDLAVLSTQKKGQPYASLVAVAVTPDLNQILFLTPSTTRIEHRLIPEMIQQAAEKGLVALTELPYAKLANEIRSRQEIYDHWVKVYWSDFIPFAHGIRLFGQVYNDAVQPEDAYEFMGLLEKTRLKSIHRNHLLQGMADLIRQDSALKQNLAAGETPDPDHPFMVRLQDFISEFGDLACQTMGASECQQGNAAIIRLVLEFSKSSPKIFSNSEKPDKDVLKRKYLNCFTPDKQAFAREVLHLGRESYRLRDDDNLHLGRIEARLAEAVQAGQLRLAKPGMNPDEVKCLTALTALSLPPEVPAAQSGSAPPERAPDPNMTFVVPLAAAVVEERGGMLIHGAIIAREYELPCVTGAARSTQLIHTGDQVTVDGYLGIVTCDTGALES